MTIKAEAPSQPVPFRVLQTKARDNQAAFLLSVSFKKKFFQKIFFEKNFIFESSHRAKIIQQWQTKFKFIVTYTR